MIRLQIQSDVQDNALDIVKAAIAAESKRLEIGLQRTELHIAAYESRYGISFFRDVSGLGTTKPPESDSGWLAQNYHSVSRRCGRLSI